MKLFKLFLFLFITGFVLAETIEINPNLKKQTIDGFGGSIAFWGVNGDDQAIDKAVDELSVKIIRVQGEVSPKGEVDFNRQVLTRLMNKNPDVEVLLTFWQPRSIDHVSTEYWLELIDDRYILKPDKYGEWAKEIVHRILLFRSWGANVNTVAVQNEPNFSHEGTQTCFWEPLKLKEFIDKFLYPEINKHNIEVNLAAAELAYSGYKGSELSRFMPVFESSNINTLTYHMYDSYEDGSTEVPGLDKLRETASAVGRLKAEKTPDKKLWMTETTGAQWNSSEWHTTGWYDGITEYEQAIWAAKYIHTTLVDAEANAFLWWGLIYSLAPEYKTNPRDIQKHRDEGLILVSEKTDNGQNKFLECTQKFHTFKQYSKFIKPGYKRLETPKDSLVSAFINPDGNEVVVVGINSSSISHHLDIQLSEGEWDVSAFQTDKVLKCKDVLPQSEMPEKSVRTWVFSKVSE